MIRKLTLIQRICRRGSSRLAVILAGLVIVACSGAPADRLTPGPSAVPTRAGELTPLASPTTTESPTPQDPSTPTPLPTFTPTLRSHTVQQGEDMFGIAWRYRVSLEDLKTANPTVHPNLLSIGAQLVIPYSETPVPPASSSQTGPPGTITPVPVDAQRANCWRTEEGGAWCIQPIQNDQDYPLESVSAVFQLVDRETQASHSQAAFLPLDILPPGKTLPLMAYFPPPLPQAFDVHSQLRTGLPSPDDGRYLPAHAENARVMIDASGLSAQIYLDAVLDLTDTTGQRVWVVAVAYNASEQIVGVRRWENEPSQVLVSGQALPVEMQVYSLSGPIARVDLLIEARP